MSRITKSNKKPGEKVPKADEVKIWRVYLPEVPPKKLRYFLTDEDAWLAHGEAEFDDVIVSKDSRRLIWAQMNSRALSRRKQLRAQEEIRDEMNKLVLLLWVNDPKYAKRKNKNMEPHPRKGQEIVQKAIAMLTQLYLHQDAVEQLRVLDHEGFMELLEYWRGMDPYVSESKP